MDSKLLNMALSKLADDVEKMKAELTAVKQELTQLKNEQKETPKNVLKEQITADTNKNVLLDAREVMGMLRISFNTLYKLVQKGLIKRIKINQRRIRYEKSSIMNYIESNASYDV